jgi:hypothetical protein
MSPFFLRSGRVSQPSPQETKEFGNINIRGDEQLQAASNMEDASHTQPYNNFHENEPPKPIIHNDAHMQISCQRCHHWHPGVLFPPPTTPTRYRRFLCGHCHHPLFGVGGSNSATDTELLSQETIELSALLDIASQEATCHPGQAQSTVAAMAQTVFYNGQYPALSIPTVIQNNGPHSRPRSSSNLSGNQSRNLAISPVSPSSPAHLSPVDNRRGGSKSAPTSPVVRPQPDGEANKNPTTSGRSRRTPLLPRYFHKRLTDQAVKYLTKQGWICMENPPKTPELTPDQPSRGYQPSSPESPSPLSHNQEPITALPENIILDGEKYKAPINDEHDCIRDEKLLSIRRQKTEKAIARCKCTENCHCMRFDRRYDSDTARIPALDLDREDANEMIKHTMGGYQSSNEGRASQLSNADEITLQSFRQSPNDENMQRLAREIDRLPNGMLTIDTSVAETRRSIGNESGYATNNITPVALPEAQSSSTTTPHGSGLTEANLSALERNHDGIQSACGSTAALASSDGQSNGTEGQ